MKPFINALAFILIAALTASCAKKESEDAYDIEQRSLDAWIAQNKPNAVKYDNGVYIEWLEKNDQGKQVEYGNWFRLNYTGRTLDGNVFKTRNADIARKEGTFTLRTNYAPDFINYYELNGLTNGENFAIGQMREGDKIIAYIPSRLGYKGVAQSFTNGYGGHYTIHSTMIPMQIEMELLEVIPDASTREYNLVEEYAKSIGMTQENKIQDGLYIKIISEFTDNNQNQDQNDDNTGDNTDETEQESNIINEDETVYIYLNASIIQENPDYNNLSDLICETFLVDSNIDSVMQKQWNEYTPGSPRSIIPKYADDEYVPAFKSAFDNLDIKWQSHFRILTTSDLAYAETGNEDADLEEPFGVVEPFTPMVFDVFVQREDFAPGDAPDTDYGPLK